MVPGLTPDAEHFVYKTADGQLRIMDTATGEHGPVEGVDAASSFSRGTIALHLETLRVLQQSAGQLSIVDAATSSRHPLPDNRSPQNWYQGVFSGDGALLAYPVGQLERSEILVWDAEQARLLYALTGPRDTVGRLAFSPDNRTLAAVSADHALRQWDLETGQPTNWLNRPQHADRIWAVAYSPDGSLIATGSKDRTVRLWDSATGRSVAIYVGHQSEITMVKFSLEGSRLISASVDGEIRLWDLTGQPDPRIFAGHTLYVYGVAVSPDGARVASVAWDGTVRIWDADSGDPVVVLPLSPGRRIVIRALAWHPDGSQIAVYDTDLDPPYEVRLRIVEPSTGASRIVFAPLNPGPRAKVAYDRSGSRLVLSDTEAGHAVILETGTFGEVGRVTGNGPCAISPAGPNLLATTSPDNRILLFDADSLELVTELAGHDRPIWDMAFSADGRYLASGGEDRVVKVWDTATGEQLTELRGHTDRVFAVTFSPDGSRIASGSDDHSIRLWETASFAEVCHLHGHEQYVYSLAFSPDGQRLYSGSGDSTVRVWELDPLRKRIAARLLRRQLVAKLQPLISRLFEDYGAVHDVLTRLRQDALLGDREREVALQLTLAEAVRRRTRSDRRP